MSATNWISCRRSSAVKLATSPLRERLHGRVQREEALTRKCWSSSSDGWLQRRRMRTRRGRRRGPREDTVMTLQRASGSICRVRGKNPICGNVSRPKMSVCYVRSCGPSRQARTRMCNQRKHRVHSRAVGVFLAVVVGRGRGDSRALPSWTSFFDSRWSCMPAEVQAYRSQDPRLSTVVRLLVPGGSLIAPRLSHVRNNSTRMF